MGPGNEATFGAPDHVTRMKALMKRHRGLAWLRPGQAGVAHHTATWLETSADHRIDGTPVTVSRETLGMLVDYLEARLGR
jgi:hypothetical protein